MNECYVMNVVEVLSKLRFFSTLIDRSKIHGKEKEGLCIQWFQREEFLKRGNPILT